MAHKSNADFAWQALLGRGSGYSPESGGAPRSLKALNEGVISSRPLLKSTARNQCPVQQKYKLAGIDSFLKEVK